MTYLGRRNAQCQITAQWWLNRACACGLRYVVQEAVRVTNASWRGCSKRLLLKKWRLRSTYVTCHRNKEIFLPYNYTSALTSFHSSSSHCLPYFVEEFGCFLLKLGLILESSGPAAVTETHPRGGFVWGRGGEEGGGAWRALGGRLQLTACRRAQVCNVPMYACNLMLSPSLCFRTWGGDGDADARDVVHIHAIWYPLLRPV